MDKFIKLLPFKKLRRCWRPFSGKRGFPVVVGAIGGIRIPLKASKLNHEQYINRNGFVSVQL